MVWINDGLTYVYIRHLYKTLAEKTRIIEGTQKRLLQSIEN